MSYPEVKFLIVFNFEYFHTLVHVSLDVYYLIV
jgi:hypothetical protein